jgi:hypothetical protein
MILQVELPIGYAEIEGRAIRFWPTDQNMQNYTMDSLEANQELLKALLSSGAIKRT